MGLSIQICRMLRRLRFRHDRYDQRETPGAVYLTRIPNDLLVLVLELLDHRDLCQLMVCSKTIAMHAAICAAFRGRSRLVIPPDPQRNHALVTSLLDHPQLPSTLLLLHTRFTVENPDSLNTLQAIGHRVQSLTIQQEWVFANTSWRPLPPHRLRPFSLESLSRLGFSSLVELEITAMQAREPLDLQHIHDGAPQLVKLTLSESRATQNRHVLQEFTQLRAFTIRRCGSLQVPWDLGDFVGMPVLEELCVWDAVVSNPSALARVRPLRVLQMQGAWQGSIPPTEDAWRVHVATLETLQLHESHPRFSLSLLCEAPQITSVEADIDFIAKSSPSSSLVLSSLATTLRTLRLHWRQDLIDLEIIATLTALQHLKVYVHKHATHCRELRKLQNLQSVELIDGWVRDFIMDLPKLRVLKCQEVAIDSSRAFAEPVDVHEAFASPLRRVVVEGDVVLTLFAVHALQFARDVGVVARDDPDLSLLWRLAHIRRLVLESSDDPQLLCQLVEHSQSLVTLEELHIYRNITIDDEPLAVPSGITCATRLRVLKLDDPCSLRHIATLTTLECLYLWDFRGRDVTPLRSLHKLREVAIPMDCCCLPLRKARGKREGKRGALPALQRIFHPFSDCLVAPTCQRHDRESAIQREESGHPWPKWFSEM